MIKIRLITPSEISVNDCLEIFGVFKLYGVQSFELNRVANQMMFSIQCEDDVYEFMEKDLRHCVSRACGDIYVSTYKRL